MTRTIRTLAGAAVAFLAANGCAPVDDVHSERSALLVRFTAGSGECTGEDPPQNECSSFEFTELVLGEVAEAAFSFRNTGEAPLTFSLSLADTSDEAFALEAPLPSGDLVPGGLDHVRLSCTPATPGVIEGRLVIETDAQNVPGTGTSILLTATASEPPPPP